MPKPSAQMATDPSRDHGSLAEIFPRYEAHLRATAQKLTYGAAIAEDLVQETFVRASQRFAQFHQGTNAGAWLVTILTNLFYDHLRHDAVIAKAIPGLIIHFGFVGGDSMLTTISDDCLRDAIAQLEPELRDPINYQLQGLPRHEIARRLGVPAGTVATRSMRARQRLRELLHTMVPDLEDR
jgi:RNA polymerase sigma-70 factor (ECF subfamily)